MGKRRSRRLTEDELALWRQVAETARPRAAPVPVPPPPPPEEGPLGLSAPRGATAIPAPLRPAAKPAAAPRRPAKPAPAPTPGDGLDRRTAERLRKGRREPDARLDLHGMTADRAHAALRRFVHQSRMAGLRCVLVITGKGAAAGPREFGDPAPGVLRREAPIWLSTRPLADAVVNVSQAHPRHGGGGALYVYLKRDRARG